MFTVLVPYRYKDRLVYQLQLGNPLMRREAACRRGWASENEASISLEEKLLEILRSDGTATNKPCTRLVYEIADLDYADVRHRLTTQPVASEKCDRS